MFTVAIGVMICIMGIQIMMVLISCIIILCGVLSVAYALKNLVIVDIDVKKNVSSKRAKIPKHSNAIYTKAYSKTQDKGYAKACADAYAETRSIPCKNNSSVDIFKPNQIETMEDMMSYGYTPYMLLISPMQSGKTNIFLLYAFQDLYQGIHKNVVIFSGCSERKLYQQLKNDLHEAQYRYANFAYDCGYFPTRESALNCAKRLQEKIHILWGPYLHQYNGPCTNTLFILEESHYAQGKGQIVDQFMKKIGLCANGEKHSFRQRGNSMISVSATPFSEVIDDAKFNQHKAIVFATIGEGYKSVKDLEDAGCIDYYKGDYMTKLEEILRLYGNENKYGLLRVTDEEELIVARDVGFAYGWDVREYDLKVKNRHCHIEDLGLLAHVPENPTLILMIDKCRMGTVIQKTHIAFAMETSKEMNADTALQSFLGRLCGYDANLSVKIYLPHKICEKSEIERYLCMCRDLATGSFPEMMPTTGKNILSPKKLLGVFKGIYRIIPIEISQFIPVEMLTGSIFFQRNFLLQNLPRIIETLENNSARCLNNDAQKQEIIDKLRTHMTLGANGIESPYEIRISDSSSDGYNTDHKILETIYNMQQQRIPLPLHASCGSKSNTDREIRIWIVKENRYFAPGTIFIDTRTISKSSFPIYKNMPSTTGEEMFDGY